MIYIALNVFVSIFVIKFCMLYSDKYDTVLVPYESFVH